MSTFGISGETDCTSVFETKPVIEFIDTENELTYNLQVSKRHLKDVKLRHQQQLSHLMVKGDTLGLTYGSYGYNILVSMGFKKTGAWGKAYCPYIRSVNLKLNYQSEIYVAKEYTSNKCAFDVILKHELDHHHVNTSNKRKYFQWLKDDFPAVLQEVSKSYEPVSKNELGPKSKKIQQDVENIVTIYVDNMNSRMEVENQKLDTRAEYKRLNKEIRQCYARK